MINIRDHALVYEWVLEKAIDCGICLVFANNGYAHEINAKDASFILENGPNKFIEEQEK